MAESWIKMRTTLSTNPKVVGIAIETKVHVSTVCGACFMLWSLADAHTVTGKLHGYTYEIIDSLVGVSGFSCAAERVNWLARDERGVVLPRFGTHNGNSAKRRAAKAKSENTTRGKRGQFVDNRVHVLSTKCPPTAEQSKSRAEQQRAEESKRRESSSSNAAASNASPSELCSLLMRFAYGGVPVFDRQAAAAIAEHPNVSRMQIAWVNERMKAVVESGKSFRSGVAAYARSMLEGQSPTKAWVEKYQRAEIARMARKDQHEQAPHASGQVLGSVSK